MIFAALDEADRRDELFLVEGGLLRYHLRKDGVATIREVLVLRECRGRGIGRELVERVRRRHPAATLRARCPAELPSNGFWRRLGFSLVSSGAVNVWERQA